MRYAVKKLVSFGKLPTDSDPIEYWDEYFEVLLSIERPTTLMEAEALLECFHETEGEGANGGAQKLITIIESSGFRFKEKPDFKNEWHKYMWERQNR